MGGADDSGRSPSGRLLYVIQCFLLGHTYLTLPTLPTYRSTYLTYRYQGVDGRPSRDWHDWHDCLPELKGSAEGSDMYIHAASHSTCHLGRARPSPACSSYLSVSSHGQGTEHEQSSTEHGHPHRTRSRPGRKATRSPLIDHRCLPRSLTASSMALRGSILG